MQENVSDLARKYQEEMLRLYRQRQPETAQIREDSPLPASMTEDSPAPMQMQEETFPTLPAVQTQPDAADSPEEEWRGEEDYDDPALPQYIQPVTPQLPEEWKAQEAYEERNTAQGYLRVIAAAADSAYPVPDASVAVFTNIGGKAHLSYLMMTDENGETPTVTLPAPPANLSQLPENQAPYGSCDIRISAKGFFKTQALDVHIFAGVTTRQVFQLVPLPLGGELPGDNIDPNAIGRTEDCQGDVPC